MNEKHLLIVVLLQEGKEFFAIGGNSEDETVFYLQSRTPVLYDGRNRPTMHKEQVHIEAIGRRRQNGQNAVQHRFLRRTVVYSHIQSESCLSLSNGITSFLASRERVSPGVKIGDIVPAGSDKSI